MKIENFFEYSDPSLIQQKEYSKSLVILNNLSEQIFKQTKNKNFEKNCRNNAGFDISSDAFKVFSRKAWENEELAWLHLNRSQKEGEGKTFFCNESKETYV